MPQQETRAFVVFACFFGTAFARWASGEIQGWEAALRWSGEQLEGYTPFWRKTLW